MRLTSLFKCVLVLIVRVDITVALFLNKCPDKLMWDLRAKNLCGARDKYMCLYDTNAGSFRELCKDEPEFHRPGYIFIISGNLKYFAGRSCKIDKYQPHKWWTNGSSECQYLKSTCNEEGQVPYDDGTATNDRKCRCDYTNYYTFVSGVSNKCYCDHTVEDCSCNKKKCSDDQVLTPDYDCVGIHAWTGRFVCPEYKAPKIVGEKKLSQITTTICPLVKPDFPGTIQQSKARIALTTMFVVIILSGVIVLVMIRRSYRLLGEGEKIVKELEEKDLHNIQLTAWFARHNTIATTNAINNLYSELQRSNCITIVGPRGCGKSSTLHAAVKRLMNDDSFDMMPCTEPSDIFSCLRTNCKQIFVFDEVCETTSRAVSFLDEWSKKAALIEEKIKTKNKNRKKIVIAFDSISFNIRREVNFSSFWSEFDMLSEGNKLSEKEARDIAKIHGITDETIIEYSKILFFYPELCRRYNSCEIKGNPGHIESLLYLIIDDFLKVRTEDDKVFLAALSFFVVNGKKINPNIITWDTVASIAGVLRLPTSSLSTFKILHKLKKMSESNIYIKNHINDYIVINDEIFMGIVSFFFDNYTYLILEMSNGNGLIDRFNEWKTHIKQLDIKLPHHNKNSLEDYFRYLSIRVKNDKEMCNHRYY